MTVEFEGGSYIFEGFLSDFNFELDRDPYSDDLSIALFNSFSVNMEIQGVGVPKRVQ